MRVKVDFDRCEAYGECVFAAEEVFDLGDDDETVRLLQEEPPDALRKKVDEAVRVCPTQAITVED